MRQRTVSLCRRNSETCSIIGDIARSHISLNQLHLSRRQMSLTQSEPDSDKEGATGPGKFYLQLVTHLEFYPHMCCPPSILKLPHLYTVVCFFVYLLCSLCVVKSNKPFLINFYPKPVYTFRLPFLKTSKLFFS